MVDIGIENWMPTLFMDTFNVDPHYSSFLMVILLGVNLLGVLISEKLYNGVHRNEIVAMLILYLIVLPTSLAMLKLSSLGIFFAIVILIYMTVLIYGSNQNINIYYPTMFAKYNIAASVAGIINLAAAFGNVLSLYGFGKLADTFGRNAVLYLVISAICIIIVVSIILVPIRNRFLKEK